MTTERLVEIVKQCGQSIVDNAEMIVGDYQYQTGIHVSFDVGMDNMPPEINATTTWMPEKIMEDVKRSTRIEDKGSDTND